MATLFDCAYSHPQANYITIRKIHFQYKTDILSVAY